MANAIETIVFGALKSLVDNGDGTFRCYPDVGPAGAVRPYVTYQQVGGQSPNILQNVIGIQNSRIQINVWADNRLDASNLLQSIATILTNATYQGVSLGAPVSTFEFDTRLYGARQDFSMWWTP